MNLVLRKSERSFDNWMFFYVFPFFYVLRALFFTWQMMSTTIRIYSLSGSTSQFRHSLTSEQWLINFFLIIYFLINFLSTKFVKTVKMISFQPRTLVNGSMLRNFSGQHVSIHVNVPTEVERQAATIKAKTTDDVDVTISLSEPLNAPVKGWIEVIGVPTSPNTILNKEVNFIEFQITCCCEIIESPLMKLVCACFLVFNFH